MSSDLILVEDNSLAADTFLQAAADYQIGLEIEVCSAEADFRASMTRWRSRLPQVIVMDVMLRWARAVENAPRRPPDYDDGSRFRAGLRCAQMLRSSGELGNVPLIIYTVLQRSELDRSLEAHGLAGVPIVRKAEGFPGLYERMRRLGVQLGGAR